MHGTRAWCTGCERDARGARDAGGTQRRRGRRGRRDVTPKKTLAE